MEIRINKDISNIREKIIQMTFLVESSVKNAVESFLTLDIGKAQLVIGNDREINMMEIEIDQDTVDCLALNSPVARDLRFLFCIQKMNKDLKRIGDHAVNIAQSTISCMDSLSRFDKTNIEEMISHALNMLHDAIECFKNTDPQLALQVLESDDQVDDLNG